LIYNRPGLDTIAFRAGTQPQFKATLLAALSDTTWLAQRLREAGLQDVAERFDLALTKLKTRTDDDFTIALLDGWSVIADVLTFYNERILNEAYLRTATERRSVLELARAIGYELKPGVAASAWLAFTVEDAEGSPRFANIPAGTKVQSVPGPDQKPQMFETSVELKPARAEWNAIAARSAKAVTPGLGATEIWLQGTRTNLHPGDAMLFVGNERLDNPGSERWDFRLVKSVNVEQSWNRTHVAWEEGLGKQYENKKATPPAHNDFKVYALRLRASVFGHNAPDWRTLPGSAQASYLGLDDASQLYGEEKMEWPDYNIYAPVFPEKRVPAPRTVYPTPKEVADAAKKVAEEVANTEMMQVPAKAVATVNALTDVVKVAAKTASDVVVSTEEIASQLGKISEKIVYLIDGIGPRTEYGESHANVHIWNSLMNFRMDLAPPSFPTIQNNSENFCGTLKDIFILLTDLLSKYVINNPVLLPFNTIRLFLELGLLDSGNNNLNTLLNDPKKIAKLLNVKIVDGDNNATITNIANELQKDFGKFRELLGTIAAVPETRLIALCISKVVEAVLHPPAGLGLPAPTPESVAAAARIIAKVSKYAAILLNLNAFIVNTVTTSSTNLFVKTILDMKDLPHATIDDIRIFFKSIHSKLGDYLTPNGDPNQPYNLMPSDFRGLLETDNPNHYEEDRIALSLVLGMVGLAGGGTIALGTVTAALSGFSALSAVIFIVTGGIAEGIAALLAAPLLLLAPLILTIVSVATAATIAGAIIAGPELADMAKRTESAVVDAVDLALKPRQVVRRSSLVRDPNSIDVDGRYPQIIAGSWLALRLPNQLELYSVTRISDASRTEFLLTGKTTRAFLQGENLPIFSNEVRTTEVFAQSEELSIAETPFYNPVMGNTIELSGIIKMPEPPRTLLIQGRPARICLQKGSSFIVVKSPADIANIQGENFEFVASDPEADFLTEFVELKGTHDKDDHTFLELTSPLQYAYDPATVTIFANVAPSTHGETVKDEILGSGDATQIRQRFKLRQKPLTYVPSSDPSGCKTTLEIWVDDIKWREVDTLYDSGPKDRVFTTRHSDDGTVTVQFGDGRHGARLPSGNDNVRAIYRKGIGADGLVKAGQLSLLMTRPLGVRSVTNPIASANASDPQTSDEAKRYAPLTVLTLDRIVSLQDYEDFALNFDGIAKALAVQTWGTQGRGVFLTVAGANGAQVTDERIGELVTAISQNGDPFVPVQVKSYSDVKFNIRGSVMVDADRDTRKVETEIKNMLKKRFSFDMRDFGQGVALSEVVGMIQSIPGVKDAAISLTNQNSFVTYVAPKTPVDGTADIEPAELITLDVACLSELEVKSE
jgi:hypothetical protein